MSRKPSAAAEQRGLELAGVLDALKRGLGERLRSAVLFGSRARGDADEWSDWDLLVIAHDLPEKALRRHLWLKEMLPDAWRSRVAILAKTPDEFAARLPALYLDIALDGVVLYDADGEITRRLAGLRRLIREQGLRREGTQRDMTWGWKRFPGFDWSLEWEMAQ